MRLLWLPKVLRGAGLTVHEVSGWRERGADSYGPVRGITIHHTAGSLSSTDAAEIGVLLRGSRTAPPPISQLYLSRTGHWHVVASGLCYHSLLGWGGPNEGFGNDSLLGVEAQHSGGSEPWTDVQYRSYVRGVAALVRHQAPGYAVTVARVAGHKEHQPGNKSDPTFDMTRFRVDVAAVLRGEDDDMAADDVWKTEYREYIDQDGNRVRDSRTTADILYSTHAAAVRADRAAREHTVLLRQIAGAPTDQLIEEIRAQGEQTRASLLAQVRELAPGLAAAVADRLGAEVTAGEVGEAIARELAALLADAAG